MMPSSRLPLDSSYRKLIDQRHLRDTVRTKIQPSVAWAELNANWIRGKGNGGVGLNERKNRQHFRLGKLYRFLPWRNSPFPFPEGKNSPVTWIEVLKSAGMFLGIQSDIFITILRVKVVQNFQVALQGRPTFLRPSPAFCRLIFSGWGGTMAAVFDARQKKSCVQVSFNWKKSVFFGFFGGGGL